MQLAYLLCLVCIAGSRKPLLLLLCVCCAAPGAVGGGGHQAGEQPADVAAPTAQ
jgi:hypothetical protein